MANPPYFSPLTVREVYYGVLLPFGTFAIVYSLVRSERQAHRLLTALTAGTVLCSIYAMVEYGLQRNVLLGRLIAAGGEINLYLVDIFQYGAELPADGLYRTFATFINPIEFATFLTVVLPYPILAALHHQSRRAKLLYGLAAAAIFVALVLTFSRGAWITAVVIGGVLFLFDRSFRRLTFPLVVVGLIVAIILAPVYGERVRTRILDSATVSTRFGLNRLALFMWVENPFIGVGYGNIRNLLVPYADRYGEKWMEEPVEWFSQTEVTYTQLLAETGVVGFSIYLSMLGIFFAACYRRVREGGPSVWLAAAVGLGGLAFAFNGLGSGTTLVMVMATQAFWINVGLALRLSSMEEESDPAEEAVPQALHAATGGATP
jgi:O-antigen ligase